MRERGEPWMIIVPARTRHRLKDTHIIMDCFPPGDFGDSGKKTTPILIWETGREVCVRVCVGGRGGQWWQQQMRAALIASQWSPGRQKVRTPSRPAQNRGWVTLASLRPPSNQSDACHDLHQPITNLFAFRKTRPFGFDSLFQHIDQMNWTWRRISIIYYNILIFKVSLVMGANNTF